MPARKPILIGTKFASLTVIGSAPHYFDPKKGDRYFRCLCRCDCGELTEVREAILKAGHVISCGCAKTDHGQSGTRTHRIWRAMRARCQNKKASHYDCYGGRGIKVDIRWEKFSNFFEDMGICPDGMTLEREDNDLGYSKSNCRWATRKEQARNRRTNRIIEIGGEKKCLKDWLSSLNISSGTYQYRVEHGKTSVQALTEPIRRNLKSF